MAEEYRGLVFEIELNEPNNYAYKSDFEILKAKEIGFEGSCE